MAQSPRLICRAAEVLESGKGVTFPVRWQGLDEEGFVIRYQGKVFGYLNRCGHVPVRMDWKPGEFFDYSKLYLICTMHGALYAPESGRCLTGRCRGQGLQALPVEEKNDAIYLLPIPD
ncbi:MAG: hypothetical protein RIR00_1856 [Pseudomonadota bacterium]|jgi:nitrite reductase/ring-hydroxylating ferredoxin subunit